MASPKSLPTDEVIQRLYPDTHATLVSGGRFKAYGYQKFFGRRIADAIFAGGGREIINTASRHGKSTFCSDVIPTWFLDNWAHKRIILASYGDELATNWGRTVRNNFEQNERLTTKLREDSKAANRWNTPQGGGMLCVGVGGSVIGFGADLIIIDDPHKDWFEAHSPTIRNRVIEWFGSTLYSRQEPGATIVVLQQRMHSDDLSGFLIEQHADPWHATRLPAIAEANDPMGRPEGAALCPERYDVQALENIRRGMTPEAWAAMFQQRPELHGSGRAYHRFVQAANEDKTLKLRPDLPVHLAWDFNCNPGVHCIIGQYDPQADLFTAVKEIFGPRLKTEPAAVQAAKFIQSTGVNFPEIVVFGDRSGQTETTTTTRTDYSIISAKLAEHGLKFKIRVPMKNPAIKDRLAAFNDALCDSAGEVHYKVNPIGCPRLCDDLKRVKEDDEGLLDKSDENLTHASDADGYRVTWLRPIRYNAGNPLPQVAVL